MNPRVLAIYLITALSFGAGGARLLTIPLYADQIGASRSQIGLLFASYTIAGALLSLPAGLLADRFGRRNMLVLSMLALGVSQLFAGLTQDIRLIFAAQVLGGLGGGASMAVLMAALADLVPMETLGRSMGWLTLGMQTGFLAGPALAGILLRWLSLQQDLLVTVVPIVIALGLSFTLSNDGARRGLRIEIAKPLRGLASAPGFAGLVIAFLGATLIWGTFQAYIPIFGRRGLGLSGPEVGYLLAVQAIVNGAIRVPVGRLLDRIQHKGPLVAATVAGFGASLLVLPRLHGFVQPVLYAVIAIPMIATAFIAIGIVFVQMAPADSRGTAMGVYSTILFLGLGAGPAILAPLMDTSFVAGFTVAGLAGAALAGASLVVRAEPLRRLRGTAVLPPAP